jgi:hypothetical protein
MSSLAPLLHSLNLIRQSSQFGQLNLICWIEHSKYIRANADNPICESVGILIQRLGAKVSS